MICSRRYQFTSDYVTKPDNINTLYICCFSTMRSIDWN